MNDRSPYKPKQHGGIASNLGSMRTSEVTRDIRQKQNFLVKGTLIARWKQVNELKEDNQFKYTASVLMYSPSSECKTLNTNSSEICNKRLLYSELIICKLIKPYNHNSSMRIFRKLPDPAYPS